MGPFVLTPLHTIVRKALSHGHASARHPDLTIALVLLLATPMTCSFASAAPTQEDVFRSIQNNVNEPASGAGAMPFLMAAAAVIILLAVFTQRRNRAFSPKAANHQGKLLKEVLKTVPLRSAEVKQLKLLLESSREEPRPTNPLTLVLCPTLLTRFMRTAPPKADRNVLEQLARKTGAVLETTDPAGPTVSPRR